MKTAKYKLMIKRATALMLACIVLITTAATPAYAVLSYYSPGDLKPADKEIKNWTWSAEAENTAIKEFKLTPSGLSQQQTAIMGGYTTKFWLQNEKTKVIQVIKNGKTFDVDLSKFNHRYYSCADSHNTGWFAPVGSQLVFKEMYFPTGDTADYPQFIKNLSTDMTTKKFILLLISILSAAYETPSLEELKDSDKSSMYYYILWLSIWANDVYADQGAFHGISPEDDWDYVRDQLRVGLESRVNPDVWGSTAIYDAFQDGGAAQKYFFSCWKAAKFLTSFDYTTGVGTSIPVSAPTLGDDGLYHMSFNYSGRSDYEKEVYRRLTADELAVGWEYTNDGSVIDFKSPDGTSGGHAVAVLRLQENSDEDRFYNCGFGVGGLAGFQGCARKGKNGTFNWGNTQVYFSAVSQPLEITVGSGKAPSGGIKTQVQRYEHSETWETHYNVELCKYDSETGLPLGGSKWDVLEAFDYSQLDYTDLESSDNQANQSGSQFKKWDGWDFGDGNPRGDAVNDPCPWDINVTNQDGFLMLGDNAENASGQKAHIDTKNYTYTKRYCGGHPEPVVEESGDPEIDEVNKEAAVENWQEEVERCRALAEAGGFFHSMVEGEAEAELIEDRNKYYEQFISLTYDYSATELIPRPGYTIHGSHTDDIPVETKTITSLEYRGFESVKYSGLSGETLIRAEVPNVKPFATPTNATSTFATPTDATLSDAAPPIMLIVPDSNIQVLIEAGVDIEGIDYLPSGVDPISQESGDTPDHTFIVYDHRTEGEIHINKKDLYLSAGEDNHYDSYGDSMGDGTLEGAVYGLFALKDIIHPDGHFGMVYQRDDLVAVATTDRNGDASFLAMTEPPGMRYNYENGKIEERSKIRDENYLVGHPLIVEENGTTYYVKELTRSEGYELSVSGKTNLVTNGQDNYSKEYQSADITMGKITLDVTKAGNYFDIKAGNVDHDITLQGIRFPKGAAFELSTTEKISEKIMVPVYTTIKKPIISIQGSWVYKNGERVEGDVNDTVTFAGGQSYTVGDISEKADRTISVKPYNYHTMGIPGMTDLQSDGDADTFKNRYNKELDKLGYKEPRNDAPWKRIELTGGTDGEWLTSIAEAISNYDLQYFNSLRIEDIEQTNGSLYAVMRYEWNLYGDSRDRGIYVPDSDRLYVKKDSGNGYFVYIVYENMTTNADIVSFSMESGFLDRAVLKDQEVVGLTTNYPQALPDTYMLKTKQTPAYWVYKAGEQEIDDLGNLRFTEETHISYVKQDGFKMVEKTDSLTAVYDTEKGTYTITLPTDAFRNTSSVTMKVSDDGRGLYSIKQAYIDGSYLAYIPMNSTKDSYVANVTLTVPDVKQPYQDNRTRIEKIGVLERPIMQKIKIIKDIIIDADSEETAAAYLANFRFKAYLKSNLEQLYRAEDGTVIWQDRNGNTIDIAAYKAAYPEKVQKFYTVATHKVTPLVRKSNDAVIANKELYSYRNGFINADPNPGYTAILESTVQTINDEFGDQKQISVYNYEKFFDAIKRANGDKQNRSDNVRQFAITWYLDDEVKKLVDLNTVDETQPSGGNQKYQDEIYNIALAAATQKAENYLISFFSYDLDAIYSISWDSTTGGGKDHNGTTLGADTENIAANYCYGISEYLPYGTYVVVEQQPFDKNLGDFPNKHYKIDKPKEIELPIVYEEGKISSYYNYSATDTPELLSEKYHIRFNEEWSDGIGEDLKNYIIKAHSYNGDYEIYKYGLDLDRLDGTAPGDITATPHFKIVQSAVDPLKDYYNTMVDSVEKGGNPDSHYFGGETDAIEKIYHYGSVSEDKNGTTMEGMQTAYDGKYAPMLAPWTVTEPVYQRYSNAFYTSRLRIEKLDGDTGENILHDGAIFALYAADHEDGDNTDGLVKFYEKDTLIKGSKEFIEAMGGVNIRTAGRGSRLPGEMWTGIVPAGTPICTEKEQIILSDDKGRRTGQFEALTTTRDGQQADEGDLTKLSIQDQNVGYLETPQQLEAGVYVLCEIKPMAGYARTKPIAIEIYSDKTSYYLDGSKDDRITAAVYEDWIGDDRDIVIDMARISVNNTPIRLEVSKVKTDDDIVTYKTDTRLEGTEVSLKVRYGTENLELAYKNGRYLGYGWYKGTLEYLESRKAAGERVKIVYEAGVFAGYGLITRTLDTADDTNRYVPDAKMILYEAIDVKKNGDSEDFAYDGVEVTRDNNNNVKSIRVKEGYAGTKTVFVRTEDIEGSLLGETGKGTWTYKTIQRKDTDILYYSLGGLSLTEKSGVGVVYALKNGQPLFEITGDGLENIRYSNQDKCFMAVDPSTVIYHLDIEGNRDAMVDPTTGMAYIKEEDKILVWPVNVSYTANNAVIAREKIKTYRIATINADTKAEYTIGTYDGDGLKKSMNPVLNLHGLPVYYQRSDQIYTKGVPIYDIDGDYVRYKYYDLLPGFNAAAYQIKTAIELTDIGDEQDITDDKKLYHRKGEAYVMENTWRSGENYPNDPFSEQGTDGQADMLKRVISGVYIMEELESPFGYIKGFPVGKTVDETDKVQKTEMIDEAIKIEIVKTDAAPEYKLLVQSDYQADTEVTEPKGGYSYNQIKGAHIILDKAKDALTTENSVDPKITTVIADWVTDGSSKYLEGIPAGDYVIEEKEAAPGYIRNSMNIKVKSNSEVMTFNLKNDHTKLEIFKYWKDNKGNMAQLPKEKAAELTLYEAKTDAAGNIVMLGKKPQYHADKTVDIWTTDDLTEYTELYEKTNFLTNFETAYKIKGENLKQLVWHTKNGEHIADLTSSVQVGQNGSANENMTQIWTTDVGKVIRITIYRNVKNGSLDEKGQLPLNFEYQFNFKELAGGIKSYDTLEGMHRIDYLPFNAVRDEKKVGNYVLVETKVPPGFAPAESKPIVIEETGNIQRFSLENEEKYIDIIKMVTDGSREYAAINVTLGLYRENSEGGFTGDAAHLVETWISGKVAKRISGIDYGTYYIAELEVPDYMVKKSPIRIDVGAETKALYKVVNNPSIGRLNIKKTGTDDNQPLENARFKIKNLDTDSIWYMTTGKDGTAALENLPVGLVKADGTIEAYTYAVEEISPPDLYQIDSGIKKFRFDGSKNIEVLTYNMAVENRPTQIHFRKTDFDTGILIKGAEIKIYKGKAVDGKYVKDGDAIETLITTGKVFTITKKLMANQVYIMEETKAPVGMTIAKPIMFIMNAAGTGIQNVSNDFSILQLAYDDGKIKSLTVRGRVPTKVYGTLKDLDTGKILPEVVDGHLYEITEYTRYSDGNTETTGKETKRIHLDREGKYQLQIPTYVNTKEQLTDEAGNIIASWIVDRDNLEHTILNPITNEKVIAKIAAGGSYILTETTWYSDNTNRISGIYRFALNAAGIVDNVDMEDKPVKLCFSKVDINTEQEIVGGHYSLIEVDTGSIIYEFTKETMEHVQIPAELLTPGKDYILHEDLSPAGYAYEEDIRFTVGEDGGMEIITMQDKPTEVLVEKLTASASDAYHPITESQLPDFVLQILNKDKSPAKALCDDDEFKKGEELIFVTTEEFRRISGQLTAGTEYWLHEIKPRNGYAFAQDVSFTVNRDERKNVVIMTDKPTRVTFLKKDTSGSLLKGAVLQVLNGKKEVVISDFITEGEPIDVIGKLSAGEDYFLHEVQAPVGYLLSKDVAFTVPKMAQSIEVIMEDKKSPDPDPTPNPDTTVPIEVPPIHKEETKIETKIGTITAVYEAQMISKVQSIKEGNTISGAKTGDYTPMALLLVIIAGGILAAVFLVINMASYQEGQKEYRNLRQTIKKQPDSKQSDSFESSLNNLNSDYVFWIYIPDTKIDYPVVQGEDNEYYLNHSFSGDKQKCGCLFIDPVIQPLLDENTIIFGHNMKDGSMFAGLKEYAQQEFYTKHPYIWLYFRGEWQQASIISCQIRDESDLEVYQYCFSSRQDKKEYVDYMELHSLYPITGISTTDYSPMEKKLITLSTCLGSSKRMIVQAALLCYTE